MTTLTREAFFEKTKTHHETFDIEGFGSIGIRSCPELQRSRRIASLFDANGRLVDNHRHLRRIYMIIDQCVDDDGKPMFDESHVKQLGEADAAKLDPLIAAINLFNGDAEKNVQAGSSDTSESLSETTDSVGASVSAAS